MKTIKVIDLLNMTANKEYGKLPKKIKRCDNKIFHLANHNYGEFFTYENDGGKLETYYSSVSLNSELEILEEPILNEKEKEYLSNVIRPFRDEVKCIIKYNDPTTTLEWIAIKTTGGSILFPYFATGTMYKGMESGKDYSLGELGL